MDRTVPPAKIPEGEAADGVADAADRASMAPSQTKGRASRVSRTSRARRLTQVRINSMAVLSRAQARTVAMAPPPGLIARSSAARAAAR